MAQEFSRRQFLCSTGLVLSLGARSTSSAEEPEADKASTLDLHTHLIGAGDSDSGCRLSKEVQDGLLYKLLVQTLHIEKGEKTADERFVEVLNAQIKASGLTKAVVLAQDAVYDRQGQVDWDNTHFYVPNDYVLKVTKAHSERMIPCVSINPLRADALDELNRCVDSGARVLKIHPPIQGVDPGDVRFRPFYQRCAEASVLVLVHTGHERSAPVVNIEFARPSRLRLALDEGCKVVACHSGSGRPTDQPDMLPEFLQLLRDYQDTERLWGDTAVLGSLQRGQDFARLLEDDLAKSRLLHGSDFPFPSVPLEFTARIGAVQAANLQLDDNLIRRDFQLKVALGIGRESAEQAYQLVCHPNDE